MTTPLADSLTYPTASALRDCLRAELARTLHGPVARAVVRWGAVTAALDGCTCEQRDDAGVLVGQGVAAVRVVGVTQAPLAARGRPGAAVASPCPGPWVVTYELTVGRCYPVSDTGAPLPEVVVDQAAQRMLADQAAVIRAVKCCKKLDQHAGAELVRVDPIGPAGGCAGVLAQVRVTQVRG